MGHLKSKLPWLPGALCSTYMHLQSESLSCCNLTILSISIYHLAWIGQDVMNETVRHHSWKAGLTQMKCSKEQ